MRKNGILKDYLMFVYKKNPNMEKLGSTLTKSCKANFIDMNLVFFHESLLEYEKNLKEKLFQTLYYILQMLLSSERFFGGIRYMNPKMAKLRRMDFKTGFILSYFIIAKLFCIYTKSVTSIF